MNKETLKIIITDQAESMRKRLSSGKFIQRDGTEECKKFITEPNILLITGMRRSGKSVFSHQMIHAEHEPFINFDDERLLSFKTTDFNILLECFYELHGKFNTIILDEIQNIRGWELFVSRLRNEYKVIITGSNAQLLSSEMATHLTGRHSISALYPMSFKEFCRYKELKKINAGTLSTQTKSALSVLFEEYCMNGGLFENYTFGNEFIRNLFSSVIHKDIVVRYGIKHPHVLEEFAVLLLNYFTSRVSLNRLKDVLNVKSPHTLSAYIRYLQNTYMIFTIHRFSYKLKEQMTTLKKVYVIDNGLVQSLLTDFSENKGRMLENLVAVELKKRGERERAGLYYWDESGRECDFILKNNRKITDVIQVCSHLHKDNEAQELNGLLAAMQYFSLRKGTILTWDQEDIIRTGKNKIDVVPVWKWLLGASNIY